MQSQSDPKAIEIALHRLLQNMWYLWCGSHVGLLAEGSEIYFVFACFPGVYFCRFLVTFATFWVKMMSKMECSSFFPWLPIPPLLSQAPTSRHSGVQDKSGMPDLRSSRGLGCPTCSQIVSQSANRKSTMKGCGKAFGGPIVAVSLLRD